MIAQVSPSVNVTLDGTGAGRISLGPPQSTCWLLRLAAVSTTSTTNRPSCTLYRGSPSGPIEPIDTLPFANVGSTQKVSALPFYAGQRLWAVWSGGDSGAVATLQVFGEQRTRTDGPFDPVAIGDGFAQIPSTLFVGDPNNGLIEISTDLPDLLQTTYVPIGNLSTAWIGLFTTGGDYGYMVCGQDNSATPVTFVAAGKVEPSSGTVVEAWRAYGGGGLNENVIIGGRDGDTNAVILGAGASGAIDFSGEAVVLGTKTVVGYPDTDLQWSGDPNDETMFSVGRGVRAYVQLDASPLVTSVAGGEVVVAQMGSVNFQNGRAYRIKLEYGTTATVAGTLTLRLRRGVGTGGSIRVAVSSQVVTPADPVRLDRIIINTSGSDITQNMALTGQGPGGGNVVFTGSGTGQGYALIEDVGAASKWVGAAV